MEPSNLLGSQADEKIPVHPEEELSFQESFAKFLKNKEKYESNIKQLREEMGEIEQEVRKFEEESRIQHKSFLEYKAEVFPALKAQNEEIKQLVQDIKKEIDEKFSFLEN